MAADKDTGTPRVFLARHGLLISVSVVISCADMSMLGQTEWSMNGR